MPDAPHSPLRTYGRIKSRPIKPRQAALMETLLPAIRAPQQPFEPRALMPAARAVWLEIGFGGGEHMAAQAARHPDVLMLGAEPFQNGVASALRHIDEQALGNVRIQDGDARELISRLPDAAVERVFILFPDPWPKTRHHKRRFVSPENLEQLARVLKDGVEFRFGTDHMDYCRWTLAHLMDHPDFEWTAEGPGDWRRRPADWPPTRYESKAAEKGLKSAYLTFRRRKRA